MENGQAVAWAGLAVVASTWALYQSYRLASFARLHLAQGSLDRYKSQHPSASSGVAWALVTGASDGIGKGFAEELCSRGINVVLHGRNEKKLAAVQRGLLERWPSRESRLLVLDAGDHAADETKLSAAAATLKDLNIRMLINNVGGGGGVSKTWAALDELDAYEVGQWFNINARFPTEITRVLLPQLRRSTPALILNVGSIAGEVPSPYLSVYSGCKAFNKALSRSLRAEMTAARTDIEVLCLLVGMVSSGSEPREVTFTCPSSRAFASNALNKVGCGRDVVYGYWGHELQFSLIDMLPSWLRDRIIISMATSEKERKQTEGKKVR